MVGLANNSIQQETLLESDLLGIIIMVYILLTIFLVVSFINIYAIDKFEFQTNRQHCFELKKKLPFILMYSKNKKIVSKKTFILELTGYAIGLLSIIALAISFWLNVNTAFILLLACTCVICAFAIVVGIMFHNLSQK